MIYLLAASVAYGVFMTLLYVILANEVEELTAALRDLNEKEGK